MNEHEKGWFECSHGPIELLTRLPWRPADVDIRVFPKDHHHCGHAPDDGSYVVWGYDHGRELLILAGECLGPGLRVEWVAYRHERHHG